MSMFRAYLINALTGEEMKGHPANGLTWVSTGGHYHDGKNFVRGTTDRVTVAAFANMHAIKGEQVLTADSFDHPVVVKVWFGPERQDWRVLVRDSEPLTPLDRKRAARCVERSTD